MRLFKTPTDWELQLSEGSSGIKDLGKEPTLRILVADKIEAKKSHINQYVVSCLIEPFGFAYLTPAPSFATDGNPEVEINKRFKLFRTSKEAKDIHHRMTINSRKNNAKIIFLDIWKIEEITTTEKESDLLLKHYKSFQLNPFTFQCTKCDGHFECDIFDYAEYNKFYSSYEDDPDSLDFLCSSCSESDFNFTIMGNPV